MGYVSSILGTIGGTYLAGGYKGTDWSALEPYTAHLSGVGGKFTGLGDAALAQYDTDNAAYRSALSNYKDYLTQDPFTDSRDASYINNATAGLSDAYNKAQSSLTANLAKRGINAGSSAGVGGLAGIEAARAGAIGNAQNALADKAVADHEHRLSGLLSLMGGAAASDYSRGTSALNSAQDTYGTLAGIGLQQGEFDQKRRDKNSTEFGDLAGTVADAYLPF
ncbi:MAG TPA: hypothetical protein VGK19_21275 [Capsulimonadaceae bacterium]|jgi:hypothetical protein